MRIKIVSYSDCNLSDTIDIHVGDAVLKLGFLQIIQQVLKIRGNSEFRTHRLTLLSEVTNRTPVSVFGYFTSAHRAAVTHDAARESDPPAPPGGWAHRRSAWNRLRPVAI
jgi:hypothetical protein